MKRLLLFIAFAVVLTGTVARAQGELVFGFAGGPSLATFTGSDAKLWGSVDANPSFQVKFHFGVVMDYQFKDKLFFQPRLLYSTKGPKYSGNFDGQELSYKKLLSYIDLPILVRYMITDQLYVTGGPQIGFLLSAKSDDGNEKYDEKEYYKSVEVAFVFGMGYSITEMIGVNLTYDLGLTSVDEGYEGSSYNVKNGVVKVTLVVFLRK